MRRLLALAAAVASLGAASAFAFTEQERDAPWMLLGVSADGRTLQLVYQGGGCLEEDGRPQVVEHPDRVAVRIRQTAFVPGEGEACTADLRFVPLDVRLAAPIAGRRVRGGPPFREHLAAVRVPRVVGLDRADALGALRARHLRARTAGRRRRGRVAAQSPRPGTRLRRGRTPPVIRLRFR